MPTDLVLMTIATTNTNTTSNLKGNKTMTNELTSKGVQISDVLCVTDPDGHARLGSVVMIDHFLDIVNVRIEGSEAGWGYKGKTVTFDIKDVSLKGATP